MKPSQITNATDIEFLRALQQSSFNLDNTEMRSALIARAYQLEVKFERVLGVLDDMAHGIEQVSSSLRGDE